MSIYGLWVGSMQLKYIYIYVVYYSINTMVTIPGKVELNNLPQNVSYTIFVIYE